MEQLKPFSHDLENLNIRFAHSSHGIPLWNYSEKHPSILKGEPQEVAHGLKPQSVERRDSKLVLGGLKEIIVDQVSSEIKNDDHHIMIDEEYWEELPTDHMGTARLGDDHDTQGRFIKYVKRELKTEQLERYQKHRDLVTQIFHKVQVEEFLLGPDNHDENAVNRDIEPRKRSLLDFIQNGPHDPKSFHASPMHEEHSTANGGQLKNNISVAGTLPKIVVPPEGRATNGQPSPRISIVTPKDTLAPPRNKPLATARPSSLQRSNSSFKSKRSSLIDEITTPVSTQPEASMLTEGTQLLADFPADQATTDEAYKTGLSIPRTMTPQQPELQRPLEKSKQSVGYFKWYHIPYCVPSWVPLIMNVLSVDKKMPNLYRQILRDELWMEKHNQPTHNSFHGRFVIPYSKEIMTKHRQSSEKGPSPTHATQKAQFAAFFPYL